MATEVRVPPLGQTSNEMVILDWYYTVGDSVEEGEPLLTVETDKANVDVEAATSGTLLAVLADKGTMVEAGTVIAVLGQPGETVETPAAPAVTPYPEANKPGATPSPAASAPAASGVASTPQALPAVRQLARELGVDLATVNGSGPDGRIERSDVLAAAGTQGAADTVDDTREERVPAARAAMARRLVESVSQIPQFTVTVRCDVAPAQRLIEEQRAQGVKLGLTHIGMKALARALRDHPDANRLWVDDGPALRRLDAAVVGVAVSVDGGLLVISIADADTLAWPQLVEAVDAAVQRARRKSVTSADQRPAAVTLSNLGMHDVDAFRAIIDRDQTAIAAMGSVRRVPAVIDDQLGIRDEVVVNLTCDHRVLDGVDAAKFASSVRGYLEDPSR